MTHGAFNFFEKYRYLRKTWTQNLGLVTVGSRYQKHCDIAEDLVSYCTFSLGINALFINGNLFLFYDKTVSFCGSRSYSQLLFICFTPLSRFFFTVRQCAFFSPSCVFVEPYYLRPPYDLCAGSYVFLSYSF